MLITSSMSGNTIISVEGLSKKYILNKSAEPQDDLLIKTLLNSFKNFTKKRQTEEFLALNDVSFNIQQGDRVGIIGRNGAGKSTLLKILSRITPPTSGRIEINGRVASLLEVGTGFHGDLSGRENIYLNGSILGMSKSEIDKKFDEIVAFAEVEKFLDTPVKRYSSGMYVRLAFAVAAHLESDVLIVDEVLAVGDISFQKKCLGKMEDISSNDGRTILFVSHNMGQISSLCQKGILLNKGRVENKGDIKPIINEYFNNGSSEEVTKFLFEDNQANFFIKSIIILNSKKEESFNFAHDESIILEITVCKNSFLNDVILGIYFSDLYDKKIFTTQQSISDLFENKDTITFTIKIPDSILLPNNYNFSVALHIPNIESLDTKTNIGSVHIFDNGSEFYKYNGVDMGSVFMKCDWKY